MRAQLAAVISLLVVEPWRISRERVRRRLIGKGTAVGAVGIVDGVRRKGTPHP